MIDPLHQFAISPLAKFEVCGIDLSFTNSSLAVLVAVVLVFVLFACGLKKDGMIPSRLQAFIEMMYELVAGMITGNAGKAGLKYFPFVFSIFFFVLLGNLLGMVPYMFTFTSHIIVTFTLAMIVFLFVTILGIVLHGFHFFSLFMPKGVSIFLAPILIPVEMISYMSRPISLSVRLFANMMAGHTMMKVFAGFVAMLGIFGVAPMAVNVVLTGFEVVISMLQAYIFTVLTCVYLNDAVHLH
ncbi:MAG: F0F1 ATP synthase subunit A [Alphaproteobacteria bacterium]|nr:F0F1 ATP synthase subunit A [Alphaproteobacteria bacterium]MBO7642184.1 F0F1 ATP synthase subunit A [Alphaproteobacteria bacterium]